MEFARRLVGCLALRASAPLLVRAVAPLEVAPETLNMVDPPLEMVAALLEMADVLLERGVYTICPL